MCAALGRLWLFPWVWRGVGRPGLSLSLQINAHNPPAQKPTQIQLSVSMMGPLPGARCLSGTEGPRYSVSLVGIKNKQNSKTNFLGLDFLFLYSFLPYLAVKGTNMEINILFSETCFKCLICSNCLFIHVLIFLVGVVPHLMIGRVLFYCYYYFLFKPCKRCAFRAGCPHSCCSFLSFNEGTE